MTFRLRRLFAPLLSLVFLAGTPVLAADESPVVVELFTSQGCSSCPPADELMSQIADRDDVIALALHVDYWDYIGWKDQFADPAHTKRQKTYAKVGGRRSIYTPQLIVNGQDSIVGARAMELADAIQAHKGRETGVSLDLERSGDVLRVRATNSGDPEAMVIHMLRYLHGRDVNIERGENAGRKLHYANIVQNWQVLAEWPGEDDLVLKTTVTGPEPVVVLVQDAEQGPILAAARLR